MFGHLSSMRICYKSSNVYFKSNPTVPPNQEQSGVSAYENGKNKVNPDKSASFHSIYDEANTEANHFGNIINQPAESSNVEYKDIFSLPLKGVKKIDGYENSYSGQTLVTAKAKCLDTIKNTGIKTVIDLDDYYGYEQKIEDAGLNYFKFNTKDFMRSTAVSSFRDNKRDQERLFNAIKDMGINVDVDGYLKHYEENFRSNTRKDINNFVEFINTMQQDNVYVGEDISEQYTDVALLLNDAFNPKRQDKPLDFHIKPLLNTVFNLYYNMTPEDKAKMGWTKETDCIFMDRMVDKQIEFMQIK